MEKVDLKGCFYQVIFLSGFSYCDLQRQREREGEVTDDVILCGAGFEVHGVQVGHDDLVALLRQLLHCQITYSLIEGTLALVGVHNQDRLLSCQTRTKAQV